MQHRHARFVSGLRIAIVLATVWNQASIPNRALYQGIRAIDIRRNARTWWYDLQSLAATAAAAVLLMAAGEAAGTPWLADVV